MFQKIVAVLIVLVVAVVLIVASGSIWVDARDARKVQRIESTRAYYDGASPAERLPALEAQYARDPAYHHRLAPLLAETYADLDRCADARPVLEALGVPEARPRRLTHMASIGLRCGVWQAALDLAKAARAQAQPNEQGRLGLARVTTTAMAQAGRALAALGRDGEADTRLAEARERTRRDPFGVADSPAFRLSGEVAFARGDVERAITWLEPDAIFGDDERAHSVLESAWRARVGRGDGAGAPTFGDFLARRRQALAQPLDEDLTFAATDGTAVALASYRGRVLVVSFWFPGCAPCRHEMPALDALWRGAQGRGLDVVGVQVKDAPEQGRAFFDQHGLGFPNLRDGDAISSKRLGVHTYPTTWVIDREGRLMFRHVGYTTDTPALLEAQIEQLM